MDALDDARDERQLAALEQEVRPLLAVARPALSELLDSPNSDAVGRFLAVAPPDACVRLADTWESAQAGGLPIERVKARFEVEDQVLLEIVTSIYAPLGPDRSFAAGPELTGLLEEFLVTPVAG